MARYKRLMVSHPLTEERFQVQEHVMIWLLSQGFWQKGIVAVNEGFHIHHVDFDPKNNDPSNLELLTISDHLKLHWSHDEERRKKAGEAQKRYWATASSEQRYKRMEKAQHASVEKVKREGSSTAQLEGLRKARSFAYGGERPPKLKAGDVDEIRRLYVKGRDRNNKGNARELAARFGISMRYLRKVAS